MLRENGLDQLLVIAQEARAQTTWQGLGRFYDLRGRGLRKLSLAALTEFLGSLSDWSFEERLRLSRWIADQQVRVGDDTLLLPQPLVTELVSPTLWDWLAREPLSAEAHYLVATIAIWPSDDASDDKMSHLKRSIALDAVHDRAREKLVQWLAGAVEYNQHHLPSFYIGDVEEDLTDLEEAEVVAKGICEPTLRESALDDVLRLMNLATSWVAFRDNGRTDFAEWFSDQATGPGIQS